MASFDDCDDCQALRENEQTKIILCPTHDPATATASPDPCPVCGSDPLIIEPSDSMEGGGHRWAVRCSNNDCLLRNIVPDGEFDTLMVDFKNHDAAVRAWNERGQGNGRFSDVAKLWATIAEENINHWGGQDVETLILATLEELGEMTQAFLEYKYEGGDFEEVCQELSDLAPLMFQLKESLDERG